jgi:glycosyltransferase involved in cell wall biosynthesis
MNNLVSVSRKPFKLLTASQSFYPHIGGVSTHLWTLLRYLSAFGYRVTAFHLRVLNELIHERIGDIDIYRGPRMNVDSKILEGYASYKERLYLANHGLDEKSDFSPTDLDSYPVYRALMAAMGQELSTLVLSHDIDIVHVHDYQLVEIHRSIPPRAARILSWHSPFLGDYSAGYLRYLQEHLNNYDAVVFALDSDRIAAETLGLSRPELLTLSPMTDISQFYPDPIDRRVTREALEISDNQIAVLCVQRFDAKSGHRQLIEAIAKLVPFFPQIRVLLAGGASLTDKISAIRRQYELAIRDLVGMLRLQDHVRFLGSIPYRDVASLYRASDIVAVLSQRECFGLTLTEAMASGCSVIGTNTGGIAAQIEPEITGLLVPPNDIEATVQAFVQLLTNEHLRACLGQRARAAAVSRFGALELATRHVTLYQRILETH